MKHADTALFAREETSLTMLLLALLILEGETYPREVRGQGPFLIDSEDKPLYSIACRPVFGPKRTTRHRNRALTLNEEFERIIEILREGGYTEYERATLNMHAKIIHDCLVKRMNNVEAGLITTVPIASELHAQLRAKLKK
jgi:hypothetical protein